MFGNALGLAPTSKQETWRRLTKRVKFVGNEATEYGTNSEAGAIIQHTQQTGLKHFESDFIVHPKYNWLGASPDGFLSVDGFDRVALLEVKCPFSMELYPEIPLYYMAQIQGQMEIAAMDQVHFYCWTPTAQKLWVVERSKEYWEWMLPKLAEFWVYVKSDSVPPRSKNEQFGGKISIIEERVFV